MAEHQQIPALNVEVPQGSKQQQAPRRARAQNYRKKRNDVAKKSLDAHLDSRLYAEYSDVSAAFRAMQISEQKTASIVPISTRGVGIVISSITNRLHRQLPTLDIPINAWFRVSLCQMEAKLLDAQDAQNLPVPDPSEGLVNMPYDFRQKIGSIMANVAPLSLVLSSVGNVQVGDVAYFPRLSPSAVLCPTVSTLRNYVLAAATDVTGQYYMYRCLPGGIWSQQQLTNPDDIVPQNYSLADLNDDICTVKAFIAIVAKKFPKFAGGVQYLAPGTSSQLIAVKTGDIVTCETLNGASTTNGDVSEFASPVAVPSGAAAIGAAGLTGEYLVADGATQLINAVRAPHMQSRLLPITWSNVMSAMLA